MSTPAGLAHNDGSNKKNDVFVGNLAFETNDQVLRDTFSECGQVISVKMMTDNEGRSRGFAFVEFADPNSGLNAIRNMNGVELNGRYERTLQETLPERPPIFFTPTPANPPHHPQKLTRKLL